LYDNFGQNLCARYFIIDPYRIRAHSCQVPRYLQIPKKVDQDRCSPILRTLHPSALCYADCVAHWRSFQTSMVLSLTGRSCDIFIAGNGSLSLGFSFGEQMMLQPDVAFWLVHLLLVSASSEREVKNVSALGSAWARLVAVQARLR
jgi:hypothetical protein